MPSFTSIDTEPAGADCRFWPSSARLPCFSSLANISERRERPVAVATPETASGSPRAPTSANVRDSPCEAACNPADSGARSSRDVSARRTIRTSLCNAGSANPVLLHESVEAAELARRAAVMIPGIE